ncbi:MAG TPA: TRAP transporter substrate-binding protein DctP [Azospirillum sp.]|nr:TRAP transporter substrate-binding protein DctP [Azospirillum sp.]
MSFFRFPLLALCLAALAAFPALADRAPLIRISSENGPSHVQTRILERFAATVRERAGGRLAVDYQHSGRLYRDLDVVIALEQGKVEMALPGSWQLDRFEPNVGALLLPSFYGRDAETMGRLLDGPLGRMLNDRLESALDVHVLGRWIHLGFAHLYTIERPIERHEDIAGLRIRSPGGEVNNRRLAALGAKPLTVAWTDLPVAFRAQRIDGLLSTHATVVSAKLWEHGLRHAFEDRQYFPQYVPLVSAGLWRRLPDDLKALLEGAWEEQVDTARREAAEAQAAARAELLAHGVRIVTPPPAAVAAWRGRLVAAQDDWAYEMGMDPYLIRMLHTSFGD